jgi:hypothetical protein
MAYLIRTLSIILAITLLVQPFAHAQDQSTVENLPVANPVNNWDYASLRAQPRAKVLVITMAQPSRRISCPVRSITSDQLTCNGPLGKTRIYKHEEVAALILPGDGGLQLRLWLGFNAALGAAAWGTYVLAPICMPCAATTGVAALFFFAAAGAMAYVDDQPDRLIYIDPSQQVLPDSKGRTIRLKALPSSQ